MLSFSYWANRFEMVKSLCKDKDCVEIGVFTGAFARQILESNPTSLLLVDPWKHQSETIYPNDHANVSDEIFDKYYQAVVSSIGQDKRVSIKRGFSLDVSKTVQDNSLDFVYIDAIHTTEAVLSDMNYWWGKIKPGGWLCGHDYTGNHGNDVSLAIDTFFKQRGITYLDALTDEEYASWGIRKRGFAIIPKILHKIWIGEKLPDNLLKSMQTWVDICPLWEHYFWTDSSYSIPGWTTKPISEIEISLKNKDVYARLSVQARKSNILRLEIIYKFGGIYTDCDYDCQKKLDDITDGISAFGSKFSTTYDPLFIQVKGSENSLNNAMFGASYQHPWIYDTIKETERIATDKIPFGPMAITKTSETHPEIIIFEPWVLSPYGWYEKEKESLLFPKAWAIHRWAKNW